MLYIGIPVSVRLCVALGSPRAQKFFHKSRMQRVVCRYEIDARGPLNRAEWRIPDGKLKQFCVIQNV